ncbi:hypothetical protein PINS_up011653 [Pythium insidiosum]|nr:hypothetical protein PINS_up011653 [Pythium insidiosum]
MAPPFGVHAAQTPPVATSAPPACRFVHEQCDKQLFREEYLRSNKASGHKNLRCFPHCCRAGQPQELLRVRTPGRVRRFARVQVALGRFEEASRSVATEASNQLEDDAAAGGDDDTILLGHTYARDDLTDELKTQENPLGLV